METICPLLQRICPVFALLPLLGILASYSISVSCADEPHPKLLVRASDVPSLRTKFGRALSIGGDTVGPALTSLMKDARDESAVTTLKLNASSTAGCSNSRAMVSYDLLYNYLTADEKTTLRSQLLASAQAAYEIVKKEDVWYTQQRSLNNWAYGFIGCLLQRVLYAGLEFPDDPRAADFAAQGKKLFQWVAEAGPNNGIWNVASKKWDKAPTSIDIFDESVDDPDGYGILGVNILMEVLQVLDNTSDYKPFERYNKMMLSEGPILDLHIRCQRRCRFYLQRL